MKSFDPDLITRHAAPVPRYTSYPTAPHFSTRVGNRQYSNGLAALKPGSELSLYVHIPYCHDLCWYCGCNTKAVQRYEPVARYVDALEREIEAVASCVTREHNVTHIHWGGGSPNILSAAHVRHLADTLAKHFHIRGGAVFAVEVDPRHMTQPVANALVDSGLTRVSVGVQDFDAKVQAGIGRLQPLEQTRRTIEMFRERGITSLNMDLVYGLPHQTLATLSETMSNVIELAPDRIAVFGYAHLPSRLKHQRLIDSSALPGPALRFEMSEAISARLIGAGYVRVGIDHFALPTDDLARRPVYRNFQGYTTDGAAALIGLGASAIGRVGDAYVQNATHVRDYLAKVGESGLAIARGLELSEDDRMRAFAIERLMCEMELSTEELEQRFGAAAQPLIREAEQLVENDRDGLVERHGRSVRVTPRGRPFVRSLCARLDTYLHASTAQHSSGV